MVRGPRLGRCLLKKIFKKKKKVTMQSSCLLNEVAGGVLELCRG